MCSQLIFNKGQFNLMSFQQMVLVQVIDTYMQKNEFATQNGTQSKMKLPEENKE